MGKRRKYLWLVLAVLIAVSTSAAVALRTPSHSRLCDLKSSDLYGKVANSHPLPNGVKSVVLCHLHSDFGGGDGAWVKSFDVPQPGKFATLVNRAKVGSGITCLVAFSDSVRLVVTLETGERVFLEPMNCGPLVSSYSSLSFEMPAPAKAVLKKLDPTFNWNL